MAERKKVITWIKEHKEQLIVIGISTTALILIVWGIKNNETLKALWDVLKKAIIHTAAVVATTIPSAKYEGQGVPVSEIIDIIILEPDHSPFEVRRHIRNLPENRHPSQEKIKDAIRYNIHISDNQTWVERYMKGGAVA